MIGMCARGNIASFRKGKTSLNKCPAMGGAQWKVTYEDNGQVPEGSFVK